MTVFRYTLDKELQIGSVNFGISPIVCAPLVSFNESVKNEMEKNKESIQMIEVRYDYLYSDKVPVDTVLSFIKNLQIPFIFTFRLKEEGGKVFVEDSIRAEIIKKALNFKPSLVDIELYTLKRSLKTFESGLNKLQEFNIGLIVSYHNFENTPSKETLLSIAQEESTFSPDVLKIATTVKNPEDILRLMDITFTIREKYKKPMIIMGMGDYGKITRLATFAFGSDLMYANLFGVSAPGQLDYWTTVDMVKKLYY